MPDRDAARLQQYDLRRRRGRKRLSPEGNSPRPGAGGRAWPGPELAERIKHRPLFALLVGELLEETHLLSPTSSDRYRLVALAPFRGFVR